MSDIKEKIEDLKKDAINTEAIELEAECKRIFKSDYKKAIFKLIKLYSLASYESLDEIMTNNRHDLYEILLDNTLEEIIEYFKLKKAASKLEKTQKTSQKRNKVAIKAMKDNKNKLKELLEEKK